MSVEKTLYECGIYEGEITIDAANSPLYGFFASGDFYYDQRVSTVDRYTLNGNYVSIIFTPYTEKLMFIKIPLVSANYPNNTY